MRLSISGICHDHLYRGFTVPKWLRTVARTSLRRPLVFVLLMCVSGAYLGYYCAPFVGCLASFSIGILFFLYGSSEGRHFSDLVTMLAGSVGFSAFLIGFALYGNHVERLSFAAYYQGNARIISVNASDDGYKNIVLRLDDGEKVIFLTDSTYRYGDILNVKGRLSPIYTKGNPGDFDVRSYYLRKGIVRKADNVSVFTVEHGRSPVCMGYNLGSGIRKVFYGMWRNATDEDTAALLSALIVGDDSHLAGEVKDSFKSSNLSHILVVSGAHVGYFAATIGAITMLLFRGKHKMTILTVFFVLFGFVTGWGGAAFRSILMYIIIGYLSFGARCIDRLSACALSGLILLIIDPFSVFSTGLLLSYSATFSILAFHQRADRRVKTWFPHIPEELRTAVSCFICAQLGMLPTLFLMGNSISPLTILIVVFAGFPTEVICCFGLILTVFCSLIPVHFLHKVLFVPITGLVSMLKAMADIGSMNVPGRISIRHVPVAGLILFACLMLMLLVRCGFRRKILAFAAVCASFVIIVRSTFIREKRSYIYFLDVGQGDCALICHRNMNILVDGGNKGSGEKIQKVMEYLNINRIDLAFISHLDSDHIAGIIELWQSGKISRLYAPFWGESHEMDQLRMVFRDLPEDLNILKQGDCVTIDDDLSFEIVWPSDPIDGGNDDSMVMLCKMFRSRVLFTGDVSSEAEKSLPNETLADLSVLKVAHHGSRFSTSGAFLKNKKIDAALISVGYNHYGHPSREVLERLVTYEIPYFRTDERGCVLLSVTDSDWKMDYYFDS